MAEHFGSAIRACNDAQPESIQNIINEMADSSDDVAFACLIPAAVWNKPNLFLRLTETRGFTPVIAGHAAIQGISCRPAGTALSVRINNVEFDIPQDEDHGYWPVESPLFAACCGGCLPVLQFLADLGCDLAGTTEVSRTSLMYACYFGRLEAVQLLLPRLPADSLLAVAAVGSDSFMYACRSGSVALVEYLSNILGDIALRRTEDGYTGLIAACELGHTDVVKLLVQRYAVNVNENEYLDLAPLRLACIFGRLETAKMLVSECGASWSPTGGYGGEDEKDPLGLFDVFRHGHVDVARWLVDDCGIAPILPEPDGPENNVFRGALLSGKPELIQWLIDDYGCHISQLPDSELPLILELANNMLTASIRCVCDQFTPDTANVTYETMSGSSNALHIVAIMDFPGPGFVEAITALVEAGCCPTVVFRANHDLDPADAWDDNAPESESLWQAFQSSTVYDAEYAKKLPMREDVTWIRRRDWLCSIVSYQPSSVTSLSVVEAGGLVDDNDVRELLTDPRLVATKNGKTVIGPVTGIATSFLSACCEYDKCPFSVKYSEEINL